MSTRVYVGHLSSRATERDVENFCKGNGKIRDVVLKNGFGFVEFEDSRDAEDACHDLNGRDLCGERVIVELSRSRRDGPGGRGGGYGDSYGGRGGRDGRNGGGYGGGRDGGARNLRYGPPVKTKYRLQVENLSSRCSWQDLKDMMRAAGECTYCDAHKEEKNFALVCFASHSDLKRALNKFQGKDINGRKIKLTDDSQGGRSHSRSRSPRERRRRSPRSRSKSPRSKSPRSKSRSRSPKSGSRSRSRSPAHSANGANGRAASRSRSPPAKKRSRSGSASSRGSAEK